MKTYFELALHYFVATVGVIAVGLIILGLTAPDGMYHYFFG